MQDENNSNALFQNFFFEALKEKMHENYPQIEASILKRKQELIDLNQEILEDEASHSHLFITSLVIASFEALQQILSMEKSLEIIKYAFVDKLSFITTKTQEFLDASTDPFSDIVVISKQKIMEYGKTFEFFVKQDNDQAYLLEIKKCFYCKILKLNNAKALMPIFCDFDTNWMKGINPKKHKFQFLRQETIGTGGDVCKFYFTRTEMT